MQAVNVRTYGGIEAARRAGVVYVGRGTPLGNPFVMHAEDERDHVVGEYRKWLWRRMCAGDRAVLEALDALNEGDRVGCWCHPLPCHADVVIKAAQWLHWVTNESGISDPVEAMAYHLDCTRS